MPFLRGEGGFCGLGLGVVLALSGSATRAAVLELPLKKLGSCIRVVCQIQALKSSRFILDGQRRPDIRMSGGSRKIDECYFTFLNLSDLRCPNGRNF